MNTLMNVLLFGALVLYFIGAALQFIGSSFKKPALTKAAWIVSLSSSAASSRTGSRSRISLSSPRPSPGASRSS